ncbi:unnamed protein product [Moneuplotes crassus]|uniref:Uncharacterized protein n=1 Tax=Euplotes crassus TaxID=5936 RepID=A0AAD1UTT7_EUPCR|nr:unnamed protein product [Moneuplotes crassus]
MKKRILLSVLFIALPLYLRAIENIVRKLVLDRNNFSFINDSIKNNDFGYPAFSIACYFICELLPICTMMIGTKVVINHYYQSKSDHYGATSDNKLSFNLLSDNREIFSIKESSRIENTALSNSKGPESTVGFMKYVDELSGNELTPSFRDSFDNSS